MLEDAFFNNHVKPHLDDWGVFDRIENLIGTVPDINYSLYKAFNTNGWLELKIAKPNGDVYFQKFQLPWFQRRLRTHNRGLWILATDGFKLFLWHPADVLKLPRVVKGKFTVVNHQSLRNHIPIEVPWPWDMVREKLANE